ncbi:MAG: MATE family efflux transporter, partial [Lutimaribacter sp.]
MSHPNSIAFHSRAILALGLPLIGSHLAQFAVTMTDAIMLGWYDIEVLAQQVLGGMLFFVLFIFGSGFAWAVMPMVAEAEGAGRPREVRRVTRMAMWISVAFGVASMPLFWWSAGVLRGLGQSAVVAEGAQARRLTTTVTRTWCTLFALSKTAITRLSTRFPPIAAVLLQMQRSRSRLRRTVQRVIELQRLKHPDSAQLRVTVE